MEENENIDDLFRSTLEPVEIAPSEKNWDAIDAKLDRAEAKRKSNNRWFLFAVLAVLLSAGELIYVLEVPVQQPITYFSKPKTQNAQPVPQTQPVKSSNHETHNSYADSMSAHQRANALAMGKDEDVTLADNISSGAPVASVNNSKEELSGDANTISKKSAKVDNEIAKKEKTSSGSNKNIFEASTVGAATSPKVSHSDEGQNPTVKSKKGTDADLRQHDNTGLANDNGSASGAKKGISNGSKQTAPHNTSKTLDAGMAQEGQSKSTKENSGTPLALAASAPTETKAPVTETGNKVSQENTSKASDAPADEHSAPANNNAERNSNGAKGLAAGLVAGNDVKSGTANRESGSVTPDNSAGNGSAGTTENKNGSKSGGELAATESASSAKTQSEQQAPVSETPAVSPAAQASDMSANSSKPKLNNFITQSAISAFYSPEANRVYWEEQSTSGATSTSTKLEPSFNTGIYLHHDLSSHWSMAIGCTYSTLVEVTTINTTYVLPGDTMKKHPHGNSPPPPNQHDTTFKHFFQDTAYFNHYFHGDPGGNNYNFNSPCGTIRLQTIPKFPVPKGNTKPGDVINFETKTRTVLEFINVPVTVRYQLSKGRFGFYGTAGVSASFLLNQQATISIADTYSETTQDIDGLRTVNYGYLFGVGVQYLFYKRLSVFIEPEFRGPITSVTQDLSTTLYPYSTGVHCGLYFHF